MANRTCDQCGGAMPHRMHRQRNEKGRLVCDNCKKWPSKTAKIDWEQFRFHFGDGNKVGYEADMGNQHYEVMPGTHNAQWDAYIDGDWVGQSFATEQEAMAWFEPVMRRAASANWRTQRGPYGPIHRLSNGDHEATVREVSRNPSVFHWEIHRHDDLRTMARGGDMSTLDEAMDEAEAALPTFAVAARKEAHDSGDNAILNHCPFCGSGAITGGSDGSVECDYCHTVFTVQVQPAHPYMPQTIDGAPMPPPGMPAGEETEMSAPVDPAVDEDASGAPSDPFGDAEADPTEQAGIHDPSADQDVDKGDSDKPPWLKGKGGDKGDGDKKKKPKGNVPPQFRKGSLFFTEDGEVLPMDSYINRLALDHADDRLKVLASVRAQNSKSAVLPASVLDHEAEPEWDTATAFDLCKTCEWPVRRERDGTWVHEEKNPVWWTDRRKQSSDLPA